MATNTGGTPETRAVQVRLIGEDGNAFAIVGRVRRALAKAGVDRALIEQFTKEATSGDYNHLLQVCMSWVDVDPGDEEDDTEEEDED